MLYIVAFKHFLNLNKTKRAQNIVHITKEKVQQAIPNLLKGSSWVLWNEILWNAACRVVIECGYLSNFLNERNKINRKQRQAILVTVVQMTECHSSRIFLRAYNATQFIHNCSLALFCLTYLNENTCWLIIHRYSQSTRVETKFWIFTHSNLLALTAITSKRFLFRRRSARSSTSF